jgi:opacity protein-like surface antigen
MYVAGQFGVTVPTETTKVRGVDGSAGLTLSNLRLQDSFIYGAKAGYYFDSLKWLGLETEVFNTNPNIKQQKITVSGPGGTGTGTVSGQDLRMLTWAPINLVVRYQAGQLEPYAGVGVGVFFSRIHDGQSGESASDTSVGLNTQLGLRYLVTQNLSLFGEWKHNRAHFNFSDSTPTAATGGFKGHYHANLFVFGVGYHF